MYDPGVELLRVHVDVWLPLMLEGAQDAATPEGEEAAVSATAPLKPPVDWREIVENAAWPATNATVFGVAVMEKSGLAGAVTVTEIDVV